MANYTMQLRSYVEGGGEIFDFDYPIFDPAYKKVLETKIIEYYYFREIGLETIAQFKWYLKSKMNRVMPYYNKLYLADKVFETYDPYKNKDFMNEETRNITNNSSSTASSSGDSTTGATDKFSDTPQAMNDGKDYLTNMTKSDGTSHTEADSSESGEITSLDEYTQHIHGHDGLKYPAGILMELRSTFINIDQMVIDDLNDLFMNIY